MNQTGINGISARLLCNLTFVFNHRLKGAKSPFSQMNCPYYTTRTDRNQHFFAIFPSENATLALCTKYSFSSGKILLISYRLMILFWILGLFLPFLRNFYREICRLKLGRFLQKALHLSGPAGFRLHLCVPYVHFCILADIFLHFVAPEYAKWDHPSFRQQNSARQFPARRFFFIRCSPSGRPSAPRSRRWARPRCPFPRHGAGSR